jgi:hypothetical protein
MRNHIYTLKNDLEVCDIIADGSAPDDCYAAEAFVRNEGETEWREATEAELYMIDDELGDVVYEEYIENQYSRADYLYDCWKESRYE